MLYRPGSEDLIGLQKELEHARIQVQGLSQQRESDREEHAKQMSELRERNVQ